MWNLEKSYRWTYLQGSNRDADVETGHGHGVGVELGDWGWCICTAVCKTASGEAAYSTGSSALCSVMIQRGGFSSVQVSCLVVSSSLWPHGLQHARLPCPSPTPRACSDSCPSSWWCYPTISSFVIPFSSRFQFFPASGSFLVSQFFESDGQSIGASASASVLPMNIQDWFPFGLTSWISFSQTADRMKITITEN